MVKKEAILIKLELVCSDFGSIWFHGSKGVSLVQSKTNEHNHQIQHIRISLDIKFHLK